MPDDTAWTIKKALKRLRRHDLTLKEIYLNKKFTDADVAELIDCLLVHRNALTRVHLRGNLLTDETGIKLARFVASSTTIESLDLFHNRFREATYLALAAALCVNTSLQYLELSFNQKVDESRVEAEFVDALRLNPSRPAGSKWWMYSTSDDLSRLQAEAKQLGHPTLQLISNTLLDAVSIQQ